MPGCLEYTSVVTKLFSDAHKGKGDLTVLWPDLANAYHTNSMSLPYIDIMFSANSRHLFWIIRATSGKESLLGLAQQLASA